MKIQTISLIIAGALFALWMGWGLFLIYSTERPPYQVVDRLSKDEVKTQLEYDRLTEHGRLPEPQAELRKQQKQLIVALTEQLKRVTRK